MLASVAEPQPEQEPEPVEQPEPAGERDPAPLQDSPEEELAADPDETEEPGEDDVSEEAAELDEGLSVEEESPRWAERLKPIEAEPSADRPPRPSLFGSRKPAATPAPTAGAQPVERVARPTEPVTRMRAPAPRPAEPPRPAIPTPGELATPRMLVTREPPAVAAGGAEQQRGERRERRRITASIAPSAAPAAVAASPAVPSVEKDLLDGAIQKIVSRSAELAGSVDPEDRIPVDLILDHSRETVEEVMALLGPARSTGLRRVLADLGEIQDIIMLMQLEKGHAPADDALTLLLQIRRDLETLHAA
jgi:hypothetical protein